MNLPKSSREAANDCAERSSYPNQNGVSTKRLIAYSPGEELKISNPGNLVGSTADLVLETGQLIGWRPLG